MWLKKHWTVFFNIYASNEPEVYEFQCDKEHQDCLNPECQQYKFKLAFDPELNENKDIKPE